MLIVHARSMLSVVHARNMMSVGSRLIVGVRRQKLAFVGEGAFTRYRSNIIKCDEYGPHRSPRFAHIIATSKLDPCLDQRSFDLICVGAADVALA